MVGSCNHPFGSRLAVGWHVIAGTDCRVFQYPGPRHPQHLASGGTDGWVSGAKSCAQCFMQPLIKPLLCFELPSFGLRRRHAN